MNIVHVITRFINGGADENTLYSCNWSAKNGHTVTLLHGKESAPEILGRLNPCVQVICVPSLQRKISLINDTRAISEIAKYLSLIKPDIVHTHTSKAGIVGRIAAIKAGVAGIVHGIHIAPFLNVSLIERVVYQSLEALVGLRTKAFISVSEGMKSAYVKCNIGTSDSHHVIHSGMNLESFRSADEPENWRAVLGLGDQDSRPPIILMVAALEQRKRHLELVREFDVVFDKFPDARLLFAGGGELKERILSEVSRLSRPSNVTLLGYCTNPGEWMKLADIAVLCSTREGLPRVVVQYVAAGRPCVVSHLPGIEEILCDGVNGYVTSPDDVSEVAHRIVELLSDRQKLERMANASKDMNLDKWDYVEMCRRQDEVYENVIRKYCSCLK